MQDYEVEIHILFYSFLSGSVLLLINDQFFLNTPKLSCILYARDINAF